MGLLQIQELDALVEWAVAMDLIGGKLKENDAVAKSF